MSTSSKCNLDTRTRWAGTYKGTGCGINIDEDPNVVPTLTPTKLTYVIEKTSPGVYKISISAPKLPTIIGYGISYLSAEKIPTLEFTFGSTGNSIIASALEVSPSRKVIRFSTPVDLRSNFNTRIGYAILKRVN